MFLAEHHDYGWSVRKDGDPVLVALGRDFMPGAIMIGDLIWHPKASPRQRIEMVSALLERVRQFATALFTAKFEHKRFYERLCGYKLIRRVGTVYGEEAVTLWQTRTD